MHLKAEPRALRPKYKKPHSTSMGCDFFFGNNPSPMPQATNKRPEAVQLRSEEKEKALATPSIYLRRDR
jgi:hypothetical protein